MNEFLNKVRSLIETLDFVSEVNIIGSFKNNTMDNYSDIDFIVDIHDITPDIALIKITNIVSEKFNPLWIDYANSLMPNKFLASLYINNDNPFQFIDIGIINNNIELKYDHNLFINDKWIHLMKLWIMNFKYYLRGSENFNERYINMMTKAGIIEYENYLEGFEKLLDLLSTKNSVNRIYIEKLYIILEKSKR